MKTYAIEINLTHGDSSQWLKVATRMARKACDDAGVEWIDADVLVRLPERGRCMTKKPGYTSLQAHG